MDQMSKGINEFSSTIYSGKVKYEEIKKLAQEESLSCVDDKERKELKYFSSYLLDNKPRYIKEFVDTVTRNIYGK